MTMTSTAPAVVSSPDNEFVKSFVQKPIVVIDIGARWGASDRWAALAPNIQVYGFDPDLAECENLNALAVASGKHWAHYIPVALGARSETATLHLTRQPACSSLFPPIPDLVQAVPALSMDIEQVGQQEVALVALDDWCSDTGIEYVDAMKIDTQGSELDILRGAVTILQTVQWVEVEVEFNPIYEGQALFSDVDRFMREHGFVLWRFGEMFHYTDGGAMLQHVSTVDLASDAEHAVAQVRGQLYWGQAYYVRRELAFTNAAAASPTTAARAAAIALVAGFPDATISALSSVCADL